MPRERRPDETMEGYVINLIREEERERCASLAENYFRNSSAKWAGCEIAKAIRDNQ